MRADNLREGEMRAGGRRARAGKMRLTDILVGL